MTGCSCSTTCGKQPARWENWQPLTRWSRAALPRSTEFTVKFKLSEPNPIWWNTTISSNHGVTEQMLREDIWGDKDITEFSNYDPDQGWPLGTGPYSLTSTTAEQTIWDLRDEWWAATAGFKRMPEVERVVMLPGREESEQLLMLVRNEIDASGQISVASVKSAIDQKRTRVDIYRSRRGVRLHRLVPARARLQRQRAAVR